MIPAGETGRVRGLLTDGRCNPAILWHPTRGIGVSRQGAVPSPERCGVRPCTCRMPVLEALRAAWRAACFACHLGLTRPRPGLRSSWPGCSCRSYPSELGVHLPGGVGSPRRDMRDSLHGFFIPCGASSCSCHWRLMSFRANPIGLQCLWIERNGRGWFRYWRRRHLHCSKGGSTGCSKVEW